jgi:hypothetical protein
VAPSNIRLYWLTGTGVAPAPDELLSALTEFLAPDRDGDGATDDAGSGS